MQDGVITSVAGDRLSLHFARYGLPEYAVFLKAKRVPESTTTFDPATETYTLSCPARFAPMLGVEVPTSERDGLLLAPFLFDDQAAIVRMALDAKRFAVWSDCGMGKTAVQLEWARHVVHRTGGRVLVITMNEIVGQTVEECKRFYGDTMPILRLNCRQAMRDWCAAGDCRLAITNYEKMNPESLADQVVTEMRSLAGIVLDESSRLKTGGGKQKWALIKSCRGIEYKLSCTATPAPNDTMEFASQASFLEKMRSEGEIIWTYFVRDNKSHRWTVKPHARKAFFEFMSSWSIYVRDPRRYGWRRGFPDIPPPEVHEHKIEMTPEQAAALIEASAAPDGQLSLWQERDTNAIQRGRLAQIAKGFRYLKGQQGAYRRVPSAKPPVIGDLVRDGLDAGEQVLVWTTFNAESELLCGLLKDLSVEVLTGKTGADDRLAILERFRKGETRCLVSRASMLGYGMNLQFVGVMIFSGWSDSYESYYQAVRRAYRYGQTKSLQVHIPIVPELEGDMWDNLCRKQAENEAAIAEMEANYIAARQHPSPH